MKTFVMPLLMAAGLVLAGATKAETLNLEPSVNPLDPALERLAYDSPSAFEVRPLSIPAAKKLLASTEGPAWRVMAVQAPACGARKFKNKSARKNCKVIKAECAKANRYAKLNGKHASCSALYEQTTVLLTNDATLKKAAKVTHKLSKHHKPTHRRVHVVRKPATSSCAK